MRHDKVLIKNDLGLYKKVRDKYELTLYDSYRYIYFVEMASETELIVRNKHNKILFFTKDKDYNIVCRSFKSTQGICMLTKKQMEEAVKYIFLESNKECKPVSMTIR